MTFMHLFCAAAITPAHISACNTRLSHTRSLCTKHKHEAFTATPPGCHSPSWTGRGCGWLDVSYFAWAGWLCAGAGPVQTAAHHSVAIHLLRDSCAAILPPPRMRLRGWPIPT